MKTVFFAVKRRKQTKNCTAIFEDPIKYFTDGGFSTTDGNRKRRNSFTLNELYAVSNRTHFALNASTLAKSSQNDILTSLAREWSLVRREFWGKIEILNMHNLL